MYTQPMTLDRKLMEDIPVYPTAAKVPDVFGVEIELEGVGVKTSKADILNFFTIHNDGSLRQKAPGDEAIEYVFHGPLDMKETEKALVALFSHLNAPGVTVYPSYRTSIHVHLSCALETHRTIYNLMCLSIIFDELLVSQNGDHRIGNNFCLRARDARGQVEELIQCIEQTGHFYSLQSNNRYSSINFVSLLKFGTIEFRSLECTTDLQRVLAWIRTLDRIRTIARKFENPQDVLKHATEMSPKTFMYFVLGEFADKYIAVEGWDEMLHHGIRLANDFAFCSKWENLKPGQKKPAPPKSKLVMKKPSPFNTVGWNAPPPQAQPNPSTMSASQLYHYYAAQAQLQAQAQGAGAQPAYTVHDEVQVTASVVEEEDDDEDDDHDLDWLYDTQDEDPLN